ncbi:MAG: hypothetical protein Q7V01_09750 [Vicinamibacterales bacterium]|nr:hypothetical protein [Vicinamibacterales bacterium]
MTSVLQQTRPFAALPLHYRVLGPDSGGVSVTDIRRLFRGQRLTAARRNRLAQGARILVMCGPRIVGIAAYDRADAEVRVYELGTDTESACGTDEIATSLLDALELACMASGARRLLLVPRAVLSPTLTRRRGYATIGDGGPGTWVQKTFA